MRRTRVPVSLVELNIRRAWQRMAEEQGLHPVAAFWRWRALTGGHPLYWLREPWGSHAEAKRR
jgi:hypothetical protein